MSCGISIVTKQCERGRYYGNGSVLDKGEFYRSELCYRTDRVRTCVIELPVLKLEDRRIRCNSRICHTCVRIIEELWTIIKGCVLSSECNKLPLWNRTWEFATILLSSSFNTLFQTEIACCARFLINAFKSKLSCSSIFDSVSNRTPTTIIRHYSYMCLCG
jgi:hypothetical protein